MGKLLSWVIWEGPIRGRQGSEGKRRICEDRSRGVCVYMCVCVCVCVCEREREREIGGCYIIGFEKQREEGATNLLTKECKLFLET